METIQKNIEIIYFKSDINKRVYLIEEGLKL